MKRNNANQSGNNEAGMGTFKNSCRASCRKILARITAAREMIFSESRQTFRVHEHLLRLALNEAEAVAWQTVYPHLIFPGSRHGEDSGGHRLGCETAGLAAGQTRVLNCQSGQKPESSSILS